MPLLCSQLQAPGTLPPYGPVVRLAEACRHQGGVTAVVASWAPGAWPGAGPSRLAAPWHQLQSQRYRPHLAVPVRPPEKASLRLPARHPPTEQNQRTQQTNQPATRTPPNGTGFLYSRPRPSAPPPERGARGGPATTEVEQGHATGRDDGTGEEPGARLAQLLPPLHYTAHPGLGGAAVGSGGTAQLSPMYATLRPLLCSALLVPLPSPCCQPHAAPISAMHHQAPSNAG